MSESESTSDADLSREARLALAYSPPDMRAALDALFRFDRRLARIVSATSEPMLGQLRLAWWREALERPHHERPRGDRVLDALGDLFESNETLLVKLVDGWEHLLGEGALDEIDARAFAQSRAAPFLALFEGKPAFAAFAKPLETTCLCWCYADLAANLSGDKDREMVRSLGFQADMKRARLPREARGIAILGALGVRALQRGGRPLMEGRGAALAAFKAGLLGR